MVRQRSPGNFEKDRIAEGGCRKVAAEPRIEKMGGGGSPSGPKPQARTRRLPPTQILPQSRRGAEEGILGILGILPRRAEIRENQATHTKPQRKSVVEMAVLCRFRAILQSRKSKKMVGAARRADPSLRRKCAVSPKPKSSRRGAGTQRKEFRNRPGFFQDALPLLIT
jgi:hypothetical protein